MDLIQPFINAADAVFAESLQGPTKIGDLVMEEEAYHRKGVTLLNDQGYKFKVFPPEIHANDEGLAGSRDTEAMVLAIETSCGNIYLNIAMHHLARRRHERDTVPLSQ